MIHPWLMPYLNRFKPEGDLNIPQSLLIAGMKGLGKKELAHALCRLLLCQTHTGCGTCKGCHWYQEKNHLDFHFIEPEKNLISVDKIREVKTTSKNGMDDVPVDTVTITSIRKGKK